MSSSAVSMESFLDERSDSGLYRDSLLKRSLIGGAFIGLAGVTAWGMYEGSQSEQRITVDMPFIQEAQTSVNQIDTVLGEVGKYGLVLTLGTIGAAKISARWSPMMRAIDMASSKEMTNDGNHHPSLARRALQSTFAGNVPVIASVGVALGAFTSAIGAEVSEGPSRPIASFEKIAPGESMIVQYEGAMPMVQSNVNERLADAVHAEASQRSIRSTSLDLNLGTLTTATGESFANLSLGVPMPSGGELDWDAEMGCTEVPIMVDESARLAKDSKLRVNGISVRVVDSTEGISAINRIGVVMDAEALKACLEQNPASGDHAIILNTDLTTAKDTLTTAQKKVDAPAVVISKSQYAENSEKFWTSNVKPITNILALAALGAVLISLGGNYRARTLRNRREWATDFARGVSVNKMRAIELLRSAKDGVLASVMGIATAAAITPAANTVVAGFRAGLGFKEAMTAAGVGVIGSVGAAALKLIRPRKLINVKEYTR